jgi:hypothetical protein
VSGISYNEAQAVKIKLKKLVEIAAAIEIISELSIEATSSKVMR